MEHENKICKNCKKDFIIESEDFDFYKKLGVPAPLWCPQCRFIRKMIFTNERSLYKRTCANCKNSIISMYNDGVIFPVWCVKCHTSDIWDARDYGREYDFSRIFFEQFRDLKNDVPHRALGQNERNGSGCEYANYCFTSKDVYLSFQVVKSENIKYSRNVFRDNKNCMDSLTLVANERCYEVVQSNHNYNSSFLIESDQCVDSHFLYDCSNCVNCCLSSNLRNKSNVFKNQQLSREDYQKAVQDFHLNTYSGQSKAKESFTTITSQAIHKYGHIKNSVNATGDFIENSKNVHNSYGIVNAENVKNVFIGVNRLTDSQDMTFVGKLEECYEATDAGRGGSRVILSMGCGGGAHNVLYCDECRGCSDCFGCVGLNKKQYCILNKEYSKEEYFDLVEKIKKHMDEMPYTDKVGRRYTFGEFFPPDLSPFAYNESAAYEEVVFSKEEALIRGYKWNDLEQKSYTSTMQSDDLPDSILDVKDEICKEIIACPNKGDVKTLCTSAFRILPDELAFYRQVNLPLPRYCPNCRYYQRKVWENPFRFYERSCMCNLLNHGHDTKCQNEFVTMYSPDPRYAESSGEARKQEKIFCKECYQKEVY